MDQKAPLVVTRENDVTIVAFADPVVLDAYHVAQVGKELYRLIENDDSRQIVVDMASVKMLSSRTLGVFLSMRQKLDELGGRMVIAGIDPKLYRVFKVTNLDNIFEFYDDKASALEALQKG